MRVHHVMSYYLIYHASIRLPLPHKVGQGFLLCGTIWFSRAERFRELIRNSLNSVKQAILTNYMLLSNFLNYSVRALLMPYIMVPISDGSSEINVNA